MGKAVYFGLLTDSRTEPLVSTGYTRLKYDMPDGQDLLTLPISNVIVFDESSKDSYGVVTHLAVYDSPESKEPFYTWELIEPVDFPKGVIPVIRSLKLYKGVDFTAQVLAGCANDFGVN